MRRGYGQLWIVIGSITHDRYRTWTCIEVFLVITALELGRARRAASKLLGHPGFHRGAPSPVRGCVNGNGTCS